MEVSEYSDKEEKPEINFEGKYRWNLEITPDVETGQEPEIKTTNEEYEE